MWHHSWLTDCVEHCVERGLCKCVSSTGVRVGVVDVVILFPFLIYFLFLCLLSLSLSLWSIPLLINWSGTLTRWMISRLVGFWHRIGGTSGTWVEWGDREGGWLRVVSFIFRLKGRIKKKKKKNNKNCPIKQFVPYAYIMKHSFHSFVFSFFVLFFFLLLLLLWLVYRRRRCIYDTCTHARDGVVP